MANTTGIPLSIDITKLLLDVDSAIKQVNDKIRKVNVEKIKISADTSELESAIKRIKSEIASITGRSSTSTIELGTSRADGQITLDELTAFRKAEEALANPVGMVAVQTEFNKTAEIVKNLTAAVSAFKTEYSSIGGVNSVGNTNGLIDTNAISERIKTAVSGLNITKPVEIPIAFKGVQEAVAILQQQVDGTVINFGNSALNGTSTNAGETVSNAVKQAAEQATEALKQQAQAEKDVANAVKENSADIVSANQREEAAIRAKSKAIDELGEKLQRVRENELLSVSNTKYPDGKIKEVERKQVGSKTVATTTYNNDVNKQIVTETENYEKQRSVLEKLYVTVVKLRSAADTLQSKFSDANAAKPIIDPEHTTQLSKEYQNIIGLIDKMAQTNGSATSKWEADINAKIKSLENLTRELRNAEYVGNQLREKTVSVVSSQELSDFEAFTSKISDIRVLTPEVTAEINTLKEALKNVSSKEELVNVLNQLDVFKSKINASEAQVKSVDSTIKELENTMKSLNKISNNTTLYKNKGTAEVGALFGEAEKLKSVYELLQKTFATDTSPKALESLKQWLAELSPEVSALDNRAKELIQSFAKIKIDDSNLKKINQLIAQMEEYMRRNPSAMGKTNIATGTTYGNEIQAFISQLRTAGVVGDAELQKIASGFANIKYQIKAANLEGNTFLGELKEKATKFIKWTAMTLVITKARMYFNKLFTTVYELDEALIDLRKTFKSSNEELENFYYESNKIAKQLGVTTKEIIAQASAWSRLGFSTKEQSSKMAEYSAMFKNISPGMNMDTATDGLVSVMKAFKIGLDDVDDVVDGIMSKINIVGNTRAVSNSDIVDFLTRSSAAMAEANNTLEDTIALGTAITEITRDASNAGQVLKTVSMRIRGYDESTEAYTNDIEELSGKIADLTKTASTPGGISLFKDSDKTTFKSTREILGDISKIYDQLTDKQQAESCLNVQKCA